MKTEDFLNTPQHIIDGKASEQSIIDYMSVCKYFQEEEPYSNDLNEGELIELGDTLKLRIQNKLHNKGQLRRIRIRRFLVAAACLALVLSSVIYYYQYRVVLDQEKVADIMPIGISAVLTVDEENTPISQLPLGSVWSKDGVVITKMSPEEIVYDVKPDASRSNVLHVISTPKGGQFRVVLSDGTKIWLNAMSHIKFPANFEGLSKRNIELEGEAYFEVAKDVNKPFIVHSKKQKVEVLGTHFNINDYADRKEVVTTLIEGSVRVYSEDGVSRILVPGEQSFVKINSLNIRKANVESTVAWKEGVFMFDNEDIKTIMGMIERWYDVEVVFEGDVTEERFGGGISKFENISKVLKSLEASKKVHFKIDGRKVIVYKN